MQNNKPRIHYRVKKSEKSSPIKKDNCSTMFAVAIAISLMMSVLSCAIAYKRKKSCI